MNCDQPGLMPLADGLKKLLDAIEPGQETETVSLADAAGRVLAENITAPSPVPGFDNSAMDGYAIQLNSISLNQSVPVQGTALAGKPFAQILKPGHAVRIMTGAVVPEGADCVIMQENTESNNAHVIFKKLAERGNNIRRAGEDIQRGQTVLTSATQLNAADIAVLASVGCAKVNVFRKTRVGLLSTGDELKRPGETLNTGDIYNSNGPALSVLLNRLNVELIDYGVIPDIREQFVQAFKTADSECDFVLTSGGVSVGEADYTKEVLESMGTINFWKLAMKPGKPFAFGRLPDSYFIGLPGNPVSAIVTFHLLGSQAIRQHQHIGYKPLTKVPAKTVDAIRKTPGRMDFQRGIFQLDSVTGEAVVKLSQQAQSSHILSSLSAANCYIALEKDRANVSAGETVLVWLFDELMS